MSVQKAPENSEFMCCESELFISFGRCMTLASLRMLVLSTLVTENFVDI
jgi:hypothetical protein